MSSYTTELAVCVRILFIFLLSCKKKNCFRPQTRRLSMHTLPTSHILDTCHHPRNDLLCVEWDVKPDTLTEYLLQFLIVYSLLFHFIYP